MSDELSLNDVKYVMCDVRCVIYILHQWAELIIKVYEIISSFELIILYYYLALVHGYGS